MVHRGEIIEQAVRKSGISITAMAKLLGKSRRWMYLMFENPNVPVETVTQIGKIIHYDFSDEIFPLPIVSDEGPEYNDLKTVEYWKNKYYKLLEEYNELLKKVSTK